MGNKNGVEMRLEECWSDNEIMKLKCLTEKLSKLFDDI